MKSQEIQLRTYFTVDKSQQIVACRGDLVPMFGMPAEKMIGRPLGDFVLDNLFALVNGMQTGDTREIRLRDLRGQIFTAWLQLEDQPVAEHLVLHLATPPANVTFGEPTDSEEMRRRYEFIVNTSKEFMALISRDYVYEAVNDAYCRSRNQPREEIVGRTTAEMWGQGVFREIIKAPMDLCFTGKEVNYQAWYEHAALGLRYMDVTYYPYYGPNGVVTHAVVVSRDITERERAQQAIRRYAERLEALHEIDRAVLAVQSPEEIAGAALRRLQQLVPFQQGTILMYVAQEQRAGTLLRGKSGDGLQGYGALPGAALPPAQGCPEPERVRLLAQIPNGDQVDPEPGEPAGIIDIPLSVQDRLVGALNLRTYEEGGFAAEHGDIAREVAHPVALAIHEAQLRQALHRYTAELEVMVAERTQEIDRRRRVAEGLREIVTILNSSRPLREVIDYIVSQAKLLLGADRVAVFISAEGGEPDIDFSYMGDELSADDLLLNHAIATQLGTPVRSLILPELTRHALAEHGIEVDQATLRERIVQSALVVPLMTNETKYGAIVYNFDTLRGFHEEEIELSVSLGEQVVLAIDNARLHQRAEEAAVMEERERLARELHDSVTQSLYSLTLFAEAGRRLAGAGQLERVQSYLEQLGDTAQQALKEMRLLLYELRPVVLEQEGLEGALRRRLDAVEKRAGIDVGLDVAMETTLRPDLEEALYRIAQELLNNALKHAMASRMQVGLYGRDSKVTLMVKDDGVGFDMQEAQRSAGMGLGNVRDRTHKIGGNLIINTNAQTGTEIRVELELSAEEGVAKRF